MLFYGIYDKTIMQQSLVDSRYFKKASKLPPWNRVIGFDYFEDTDVQAAIIRMNDQFEKREIVNSGEMLHIFSLRMLMQTRGELKGNLNNIETECKQYVTDLFNDECLPPRETDWRWTGTFDRSYGGHMYWIDETYREHFQNVWNHLINAREKALEKEFPEVIGRILAAMHSDANAFRELVCFTNNGDNPYALIPILSHIKDEDFVKHWLSAPKNNWGVIHRSLNARYEAGRLGRELKAEKQWLERVVKLFYKHANKESGFKRYRIERTSPNFL